MSSVDQRIFKLRERLDKVCDELIKVIAGGTASDYIDDFVHSTNPKFKGKSKEERIQMALGAYYGS